MFARFNQYALLTAATLAVAAANTQAVVGAAQSQLGTYEDVINLDQRNLYTHTFHNDNGTGPLQYHFATDIPQLTPFNTAASVDPATGKMRAYAVADASVIGGTVAVEPPFTLGPKNGISGAGANVSYSKKLQITPGSTNLPANAPVKLTLTFHLDGRLAVNDTLLDEPGPMSNGASMTAHFTILDQAVLTGDDSIYHVVDFSANADRSRSVIVPGNEFDHPLGARISSKNYAWSLFSNDPNEPAHNFFDQDYKEEAYHAGSQGTSVPTPFVHDFDTGTLLVTFDTYVGATLDINAGLLVSAHSNALTESPYASANFMNTFALDFAPAPGFEGLALVSNTIVPEPTSLAACGFAVATLSARRRAAR